MFIAALKGLDFFSWLDARPAPSTAIARHFGFHARPVDVMTTLFVARGLLDRDGDALHLTAMAREHLVSLVAVVPRARTFPRSATDRSRGT